MRAVFTGLCFLLVTIFVAVAVLLISPFCYLLPLASWREKATYWSHESIPLLFADSLALLTRLFTPTQIEVSGSGELERSGWYLMVSNHQSWVDIFVLVITFRRKIPALRFFMKRELLWTLPVAGIACWAMGYPFMRRYSKNYLKKHPEKAGKDIEVTRKACEKFKKEPVTVINFVEGTRFTPEKHARQGPAYQHLLKPRAGGLAFVLSAMEEEIHQLIDVTIVYSPTTSLWDFMAGKTKKIKVHYEVLPIEKDLIGDYTSDRGFRVHFQKWLNRQWANKDKKIKTMH